MSFLNIGIAVLVLFDIFSTTTGTTTASNRFSRDLNVDFDKKTNENDKNDTMLALLTVINSQRAQQARRLNISGVYRMIEDPELVKKAQRLSEKCEDLRHGDNYRFELLTNQNNTDYEYLNPAQYKMGCSFEYNCTGTIHTLCLYGPSNTFPSTRPTRSPCPHGAVKQEEFDCLCNPPPKNIKDIKDIKTTTPIDPTKTYGWQKLAVAGTLTLYCVAFILGLGVLSCLFNK